VSTPVKKLAGRKFRLDVIAIRRAAADGTLSDEDRATAERFLPGITKVPTSANARPNEATPHAGGKE
jgi:hypothetical protein